jgi:hypothetical protein
MRHKRGGSTREEEEELVPPHTQQPPGKRRRRRNWCLNTPNDHQGRGGEGASATSKEGCGTRAQTRISLRLS